MRGRRRLFFFFVLQSVLWLPLIRYEGPYVFVFVYPLRIKTKVIGSYGYWTGMNWEFGNWKIDCEWYSVDSLYGCPARSSGFGAVEGCCAGQTAGERVRSQESLFFLDLVNTTKTALWSGLDKNLPQILDQPEAGISDRKADHWRTYLGLFTPLLFGHL